MPDFIEIQTSDKDTTRGSELDEIAREEARRMLVQTLEARFATTSRITKCEVNTAEPRLCATARRARRR
jgi:hypothetical protein